MVTNRCKVPMVWSESGLPTGARLGTFTDMAIYVIFCCSGVGLESLERFHGISERLSTTTPGRVVE